MNMLEKLLTQPEVSQQTADQKERPRNGRLHEVDELFRVNEDNQVENYQGIYHYDDEHGRTQWRAAFVKRFLATDERSRVERDAEIALTKRLSESEESHHFVEVIDVLTAEGGHVDLLLRQYDSSVATYLEKTHLTYDNFQTLVHKMAAATDALERLTGLVHKDLKADNYLMSADLSEVVLTDFGSTPETADIFVGTFSHLDLATFVALLENKRVPPTGHRDVVAFATMIYEMLSGRQGLPYGEKQRNFVINLTRAMKAKETLIFREESQVLSLETASLPIDIDQTQRTGVIQLDDSMDSQPAAKERPQTFEEVQQDPNKQPDIPQFDAAKQQPSTARMLISDYLNQQLHYVPLTTEFPEVRRLIAEDARFEHLLEKLNALFEEVFSFVGPIKYKTFGSFYDALQKIIS